MKNQYLTDRVLTELPPPYKKMHIFTRPPDYYLESHFHEDFYHINYIESGSLCVGFEGEEYTVREGQVMILPPRIEHSIKSPGGYSQIGIDIFETDDERGIYNLFAKTYPSGFAVVTLTGFTKTYEELWEIFRDINDSLGYLKIINTVESFLLTTIEHSQNVKTPDFKRYFSDFIHKDNLFCLPLKKICRQMGMSKTHLERLVKKEFGCGVMEYCSQIKLSKACLLLQTTDVSVKSISETLSFYDPGHFNYFFKKRMGTTPLKYRSTSRTEA